MVFHIGKNIANRGIKRFKLAQILPKSRVTERRKFQKKPMRLNHLETGVEQRFTKQTAMRQKLQQPFKAIRAAFHKATNQNHRSDSLWKLRSVIQRRKPAQRMPY